MAIKLSSRLNSSKLDASQINKIQELGTQVRPVSVSPEILNYTTSATVNVGAGQTVPGFVDSGGNALLLGGDNTVYAVSPPIGPVNPVIPPSNPIVPINPATVGGGVNVGPGYSFPTFAIPNPSPITNNPVNPVQTISVIPNPSPITNNPVNPVQTVTVIPNPSPITNNPVNVVNTTPIVTIPNPSPITNNPVNPYLNPIVGTPTPVVTTPIATSVPVVSNPVNPYLNPIVGSPTVISNPIVSNPIVSNPIVSNPIITSNPVINNPPPPPPPSLGSGKIFTMFSNDDIVPNQQETVTRGLWTNNVGNLLAFYTGSQTDTQRRYYYNVYNSQSGECGSEVQFAVIWGHKAGSGSADEGGQINDTPSRAMYGQLRQLCLNPGEERFVIGGTATDNVYAVNIGRARMREAVDEGNLELNLAILSGSQFELSSPRNAHTGSNVKLKGNNTYIRLIDDSKINSATITDAGEVYNIVSGSLEDGVYNSTNPHYYGLLYRRMGILVLNGDTLDANAGFLTVTGSEVEGDNAWKLFTSISGAAKFTDGSGDYLGFQGRSIEKVKSTHYFIRVKNQDYNFSNNPTFVTGSEGDLAQPTMIGNPQTYITTVGLFNPQKELLGVAKLSKPLLKNFSREALIKVRLDF